jgi:hypothetical protein
MHQTPALSLVVGGSKVGRIELGKGNQAPNPLLRTDLDY